VRCSNGPRKAVSMIDEQQLSEVISSDVRLRLVEPHIYSLYSSDKGINSYGRMMGAVYDLVACNRVYNRLVWGYRTSEFHALCHDALASSTCGWVLDAGCGSLAFSARAYADYSERPVVLLDQSITMLRIAKTRLMKLTGAVPANMVFLCGDALELPFKAKSFDTIISMNLLHVLDNVQKVVLGIRKALVDGGTISLTTLVLNDRFADKYIHMLAKTGEVIPRRADQLFKVFDHLRMPVEFRVQGNMAFIHHA
jgi:SAM-dependent methyltransferase